MSLRKVPGMANQLCDPEWNGLSDYQSTDLQMRS